MEGNEQRMIIFEPELCSGCMYCMTACSTRNSDMTSLFYSRIKIIRHEGFALKNIEEEGDLIFAPVLCRQCEDAPCADGCPVGAITPEPVTGAWVINHDKCIGCRMCLTLCPFGAVGFDPRNRRTFKCELCDGDPWCVRMCAGQALKFIPAKVAHLSKMDRTAQKEQETYHVK